MTVIKLRMKNYVLLIAVSFSAYFPIGTTDAETVWLKDVTIRVQTDKRALTGIGLPDQLSFHLKRKSRTLALNLKRNYQIDPNTDIYTVQKLKDGRPFLEKTKNLEKADVAYYQDMDNRAFMTARCVKRSSGQCDILINGNIQIGDRSYDLRPFKPDFAPNDFLEIIGLRGKRYILQDQANIRSGMSFKTNDNTRNRQNYYVDVLVMTDAGIYNLFLALADSTAPYNRALQALADIREYFLHIMNGVNQFYGGITDPRISITVGIRAFLILDSEIYFPHNQSRVEVYEGQTVIDGDKYFNDLIHWDINTGSKMLDGYDQVILFTRHVMYHRTLAETNFDGLSRLASVCDIGQRVEIVRVADYFVTTSTAAHELGHALGALHDGDDRNDFCSSNDFFIMSTHVPKFTPRKNYTGNPWLFSQCSVNAFVRTLVNKTCVTTKHVHDQNTLAELNAILRKQPGERYIPHHQCAIINGYGSTYCGENLQHICRFMRCTDPDTGECEKRYLSAAPGTTCGYKKFCQKGLCVPKPTPRRHVSTIQIR